MFTKRAEPCDGACDDEQGWQRLLTDLAAGPSSTGRLMWVLSQPVGAEPQWPRGRLDAVWREGSLASGARQGPVGQRVWAVLSMHRS